jgi:hypothetical protein
MLNKRERKKLTARNLIEFLPMSFGTLHPEIKKYKQQLLNVAHKFIHGISVGEYLETVDEEVLQSCRRIP